MHRNVAFTLLELIFVVAIIVLLATLVLPTYQHHIRKANRSDGLETIQQVLLAQEYYYAEHMEYADNLITLGSGALSVITPRKQYRISIQQCDNLSFSQCAEVKATAQGRQIKDGDLIFNTSGKQVIELNGVETNL